MVNPARTVFTGLFIIGLMLSSDAWSWAQARFVHAAPLAAERSDTAISLYIAGDFSTAGVPHSYELHDIVYRNYTNFFGYPAADFDILIRSGVSGQVLVDTTITLESGFSHWIVLTGNGQQQPFDILVLRSQLPSWESGQHLLRYAHIAPVSEAARLSVFGHDGKAFSPELEQLSFGQSSGDVLVPVGQSRFSIHLDGQPGTILRPKPLTHDALDQATALLVIGDQINKPLSVMAVPGGELPMFEPGSGHPPVTIDNSVLGWWTSANTMAGEGLLLQPLPDQERLVGTIYTYANDDSGAQRWYVLESCHPHESGQGDCPAEAGFDGRRTRATVLSAEGARLAGDESATVSPVGWIELEFLSCNQAVANLTLDDGTFVAWELERLTKTVPCTLD